jgi:hypothetical protein
VTRGFGEPQGSFSASMGLFWFLPLFDASPVASWLIFTHEVVTRNIEKLSYMKP